MRDDPMMRRIMAAIDKHQRGENDDARVMMSALWAEIGENGDALHRCTLAHYMADLQSDPHQSMAWNQRALSAAEEMSAERLAATFETLDLRSFFPSLHLNLAEDFRELGDKASAARHLDAARQALDPSIDSGLAAMIRGGIDRLQSRLDSA